ncbi:hypothetical protein N7453_008223 [Penicillium expansum]|nr:hypothetical protein N7453_008223 [Penicillium expansum]
MSLMSGYALQTVHAAALIHTTLLTTTHDLCVTSPHSTFLLHMQCNPFAQAYFGVRWWHLLYYTPDQGKNRYLTYLQNTYSTTSFALVSTSDLQISHPSCT